MRKERFEYQTQYYGSHEINESEFSRYFNQNGLLGWELVQVIIRHMIDEPNRVANYTFIWKRKIK